MQDKNQAYDLSRFETQEFEALKVLENKKLIREKRHHAVRWFERVVVGAILVALMFGVLYSQSRITELSDEAINLQQDLIEEKSTYDSLNYKLESGTTLTKIEEYVSKQLGMVKVDSSQVEYVTLAEENKVEKADSGLVKYWNAFKSKIDSMLAYIAG